MKILLICSKSFYARLAEYKDQLEKLGHDVSLPNCHDCPETEDKYGIHACGYTYHERGYLSIRQ